MSTKILGKQQVKLSLDEKVAEDLDTIAKIKGITKSGVVEQLIRGLLTSGFSVTEKDKQSS
jgi:metal-responsive CopG/Arc/MetJ family transcriptional regulator